MKLKKKKVKFKCRYDIKLILYICSTFTYVLHNCNLKKSTWKKTRTKMPQKPVILETVSIYVLFKEIKQPREKLHKKGDNSYTPHKIKVNTAPGVSNCMAPILSHSYIHFTHFQKKSIFMT